MLAAEFGVTHPVGMLLKIASLGTNLLRQFFSWTGGEASLHFSQAGRRRKMLRDGLTVPLAGQSIVRAVAGIASRMAMTIRIPTTTACSRNGASSHVAQLGDPQLNGDAPSLSHTLLHPAALTFYI
jgi:hypothetical protein